LVSGATSTKELYKILSSEHCSGEKNKSKEKKEKKKNIKRKLETYWIKLRRENMVL
jgi:hypothetical protein